MLPFLNEISNSTTQRSKLRKKLIDFFLLFHPATVELIAMIGSWKRRGTGGIFNSSPQPLHRELLMRARESFLPGWCGTRTCHQERLGHLQPCRNSRIECDKTHLPDLVSASEKAATPSKHCRSSVLCRVTSSHYQPMNHTGHSLCF